MIRNYSELSEAEKNELFSEYKNKENKKNNRHLIIMTIIYGIAFGTLFWGYKTLNDNNNIDDLLKQVAQDYLKIGLVVVVPLFLFSLITYFIKKKSLDKVYTKGFQGFLNKRNINLDKDPNQDNKSI